MLEALKRSESSSCPLCKTKITKRSLVANTEMSQLVDAFQELVGCYNQHSSIKFTSQIALKETDSKPIENLSQMYPTVVKEEPEKTSQIFNYLTYLQAIRRISELEVKCNRFE